jgi:hypothetical protein
MKRAIFAAVTISIFCQQSWARPPKPLALPLVWECISYESNEAVTLTVFQLPLGANHPFLVGARSFRGVGGTESAEAGFTAVFRRDLGDSAAGEKDLTLLSIGDQNRMGNLDFIRPISDGSSVWEGLAKIPSLQIGEVPVHCAPAGKWFAFREGKSPTAP